MHCHSLPHRPRTNLEMNTHHSRSHGHWSNLDCRCTAPTAWAASRRARRPKAAAACRGPRAQIARSRAEAGRRPSALQFRYYRLGTPVLFSLLRRVVPTPPVRSASVREATCVGSALLSAASTLSHVPHTAAPHRRAARRRRVGADALPRGSSTMASLIPGRKIVSVSHQVLARIVTALVHCQALAKLLHDKHC